MGSFDLFHRIKKEFSKSVQQIQCLGCLLSEGLFKKEAEKRVYMMKRLYTILSTSILAIAFSLLVVIGLSALLDVPSAHAAELDTICCTDDAECGSYGAAAFGEGWNMKAP